MLAPRSVRAHGPLHLGRASAFSGIIGSMTALFSIDLQAVRIVRAETKTQILGALADCFGEVYALDRATVLERIEERETLGSTGFGRGVAIPHARLDNLARPVAAFFRLESPVNFASSDGMPVDCDKVKGSGVHFIVYLILFVSIYLYRSSSDHPAYI